MSHSPSKAAPNAAFALVRRSRAWIRQGVLPLLAFVSFAVRWPVATAQDGDGTTPFSPIAWSRHLQDSGTAGASRSPANLTSNFVLGFAFMAEVSSPVFADDLAVDVPVMAAIAGMLDGLEVSMVQLDGINTAPAPEGGDHVSIRLLLQLLTGAEQTRMERSALQIQPSVLTTYFNSELEAAGLTHSVLSVSGIEVTPMLDVCTHDDCMHGYVPIAASFLPATCHSTVCTPTECCDPLDRCNEEDCTLGYVMKSSGPGGSLPERCVGAVCTRYECCDVAAICDATVCGVGTTPIVAMRPCAGRYCREEECCEGPSTTSTPVPVECQCQPEHVLDESLEGCAAISAELSDPPATAVSPCDDVCCQLLASPAPATSPSGQATTLALIVFCLCVGVVGVLFMLLVSCSMRYPPKQLSESTEAADVEESKPSRFSESAEAKVARALEGGNFEEAEYAWESDADSPKPSRHSESAEAKVARALNFEVVELTHEPVVEELRGEKEPEKGDLPAPPSAFGEEPQADAVQSTEIAVEQSEAALGLMDLESVQPVALDQPHQGSRGLDLSLDAPAPASARPCALGVPGSTSRREVEIETAPAGCCGGGSEQSPPSMWHGLLCCQSPPPPLAHTIPAEGSGMSQSGSSIALAERDPFIEVSLPETK